MLTGYAVSSGKRLWSIDSNDEKLDEGKCRALHVYGSAGRDVATRDAMVVVNIGDPDTGGGVGYRVYEARTGKKLILQSSRVDLYDPVKGFAYRIDDPEGGENYAGSVGVYDTATGKTLFQLDADRADKLGFTAKSLYDGYLYAGTKTETS